MSLVFPLDVSSVVEVNYFYRPGLFKNFDYNFPTHEIVSLGYILDN